jgi:pyruvate ferredoxin oxidoreductase gamma subunit
MAKAIEIRWHGRGGQGTVTAAKVLADACLSGGGYVQAFPEYGPERAGAPIRAFNRISENVIRMYGPVLHPKVVSIADATLMDAVNVTEGAPDDAIYLVNTSRDPKEVREKLKAKDTQKVFTVDATKIAVVSRQQVLLRWMCFWKTSKKALGKNSPRRSSMATLMLPGVDMRR